MDMEYSPATISETVNDIRKLLGSNELTAEGLANAKKLLAILKGKISDYDFDCLDKLWKEKRDALQKKIWDNDHQRNKKAQRPRQTKGKKMPSHWIETPTPNSD